MQSKKSSYNSPLIHSTLLRKNLTRFWPLWGGVTLLGCLIPLYLLLTLVSPYQYSISREEIASLLYSALAYLVPVFTLFYAILCAMTVWSYLYNSRSVGLIHALPLNRRSLFLTNALSGLCMMVLPYAVVGLLTGLVCLGFGILPLTAFLKTIVGVLGLTVFYFGTATLCAQVTSHIFALPAFYFIGHFFAVTLDLLISNFAANFIFGYTGGSTSVVSEFLSPTVFLYQTLSTDRIYDEYSDSWTASFTGLWAIGIYALIGLLLFGLSYLLYRARHSESAGNVVAYRWLRPIFRYGVAICSALTLGQLLYEIVWRAPFQTGSYYQMLPMGVCMAIAGILGYYVASMLLQKSLRVFRNSWQGPLMVTAMVVLLCGCVSFDLLGIARNVPKAAAVKAASLYTDHGSAGNIYCEAGDPLIQKILDLHQTMVDSEDAIRGSDDAYEDNYTYFCVRFRYELQDGSSLYREYYLHISQENWEQPGSYGNAVNSLINSPEAILHRFQLPEEAQFTTAYLYFYWEDSENYALNSQQIQPLYQAIQADAQAGNITAVLPFGSGSDVFGSLELEYRYPSPNRPGQYRHDNIYLEFSTTMTHTIDALLKTGLVTPEQLQQKLGEGVIPATHSTTAVTAPLFTA